MWHSFASPMSQPLSRESSFHLNAAEGWVELENPSEALIELEEIAPDERSHPTVLQMFWRVYAEWKKWQPAYEVASRLVDEFPESTEGWIDRAYALRRIKGGGLQNAFDALLPAANRFPNEPVIRYNLACYCAQMAKLTEAKEWLEQAMTVGNRRTIRKMAMADPDLEPLRALGYLK